MATTFASFSIISKPIGPHPPMWREPVLRVITWPALLAQEFRMQPHNRSGRESRRGKASDWSLAPKAFGVNLTTSRAV